MARRHHKHPYLMTALLAGQDWFENSLQSILRSEGFRPVTKSQANVLNCMTVGEFKPSVIAKRMRLSRQALSHIVKSMVEADLVVVAPDPVDGRSIQLQFSPRAQGIRDAARSALLAMEVVLERRIGRHTVEELWRALDADWGDYIETRAQLESLLKRTMKRR